MAGLSTYLHPSFGLGDIAQPEAVEVLDRLRASEARADAARDKLEAAIDFKRSLATTLGELTGLGVETDDAHESVLRVEGMITDAAREYFAVGLESRSDVAELRKVLADLPAVRLPESPVDLQASKLASFPLSTESLKLDSRYFSFDGNLQEDMLASIEKFVRSATGNIASGSGDLGRPVCDQISDQIRNHRICGTLVVTASATHRNVHLFSPLVLDPERAVAAWNALRTDRIDTTHPESVRRALSERSEEYIPLITGAVYGSGFVGMAHFLQSESSGSGDMEALKGQLENKLLVGGWLAHASGGMGVDREVMDEVRAFLAANSVTCHIGIVATGAVPTIKSNELRTCGCRLAEAGTDAVFPHPGGTERNSVHSEAQEARQQALLDSIRNARLGTILRTVGKTDDAKNNTLNMQTLMDALDDYFRQIRAEDGVVGIPVGFFIRRLTKAEIAKSWLDRYYPAPAAEKEK